MAQRYVINLKKEPVLQKSLLRISKHLAQPWVRDAMEYNAGLKKWISVYQKEYLPYSRAFARDICEDSKITYDDHFYFTVRKYTVDGKEVALEVLSDKTGTIIFCSCPV